MAGGLHTFAASELLTAANVNQFLMNQSIVQCTAGTRPGSPQDGQCIFETDTEDIRVWDGSAWEYVTHTGSFKTWTPALTSTGTNPTGTGTGIYTRQGRMITATAKYTFTTAGTLTYSASLPVTPKSQAFRWLGTASAAPTGEATNFTMFPTMFETTSLIDRFRLTTPASSNWTQTVPFTVAANSFVHYQITYEAAS